MKRRLANVLVWGDELYGKVLWASMCALIDRGWWDGESDTPLLRWMRLVLSPIKLMTRTARWITRRTAILVPWEEWKIHKNEYVLLVKRYWLSDSGKAPDRFCWRA